MLGCSSCPVICASSTKRNFFGGVGLVEQVLDGDFAADVAIDGAEDGPHAAAGDLVGQCVALAIRAEFRRGAADAVESQGDIRVRRAGPDRSGGGSLQEIARIAVRLQEQLDSVPQRRVAGASLVEVGGPLCRVGDLQGGGEDVAFAHDGLQAQG